MPPVDQRLVEKEGGIRNPTWLEERPGLSNVLNAFGEAFGIFPSRRIWREVVKAWGDRDKKIDVLPSAGQRLDKAGGMLSDLLNMAGPGMDAADLGKMALLYAPFKGKATPGSNAFSALWDKKPRVEISDDLARLKTKNLDQLGYFSGKLEDILEHPELFKQSPELRGQKVIMGAREAQDAGGSYTPELMQVTASSPKKALKTTIHEVGHGLQEQGGMARGGSPGTVGEFTKPIITINDVPLDKYLSKIETKPNTSGYYLKSLKELVDFYGDNFESILKRRAKGGDKTHQNILNVLENTAGLRIKPTRTNINAYHNLAGEFEARDAASRMNLTPAQRLKTPPYSSEPEIKLSDLIVRMEPGSGRAMMAEPKGKPGGLSEAIRGVKNEAGENIGGSVSGVRREIRERAKTPYESGFDPQAYQKEQSAIREKIKLGNYDEGDLEYLYNSKIAKTTNIERHLRELGVRGRDAHELIKSTKPVGKAKLGGIFYNISEVLEKARENGFFKNVKK